VHLSALVRHEFLSILRKAKKLLEEKKVPCLICQCEGLILSTLYGYVMETESLLNQILITTVKRGDSCFFRLVLSAVKYLPASWFSSTETS